MSETITLGDLTPMDVGRRVRVTVADATIDGPLFELDVETSWISEQSLTTVDPTLTPGRRAVALSVGRWHTRDLPMGTPVEVWR
jgi:hypothetical protein